MFGIAFLPENPVFASHNRSLSVNYANYWIYGRNCNYPCNFSQDCTNYVSQALYEGGMPFDTDSFTHWRVYGDLFGNWSWTVTWSVADEFVRWLRYDSPIRGQLIQAYDWNSSTSLPTPSNYNSQFYLADVVALDFDSDGIIDHLGIVAQLSGIEPNSGLITS